MTTTGFPKTAFVNPGPKSRLCLGGRPVAASLAVGGGCGCSPRSGVLAAPLLIGNQHGGGDKDRRVGADDNADDKGEGESVQYFPSEQEQGQDGEEGESAGKDGPAQCLVDALVDDF